MTPNPPSEEAVVRRAAGLGTGKNGGESAHGGGGGSDLALRGGLIAAQSLSGICQREPDRLAGRRPSSGVVERLRARGLLTAERLPQDRRRQCWRLTDLGQSRVAEIWREWQKRLGEPSAGAASVDLAELAERLTALETRCGESVGPPRLRLTENAGGHCS
jgi:hypothetical protein